MPSHSSGYYDAKTPIQTYRKIDKLVEKYKDPVLYPQIRATAIEILKPLPDLRDTDAVLNKIYWYFHPDGNGGYSYFFDVNGGEYIQIPEFMLRTKVGDCDDFTLLLRTLLESVGINTRSRMGAYKSPSAFQRIFNKLSGNRDWTHIWCEMYDVRGGQWLPIDVTIPVIRLGRQIVQGNPGDLVLFDYYYPKN